MQREHSRSTLLTRRAALLASAELVLLPSWAARDDGVGMLTIPYPAIDPVLVQFGPFAIRCYALAYVAGLLIGWRYCLALAKRPPRFVTRDAIDDFLIWAMLGVVLGGRLGYVLFYKPGYYLAHPLETFEVWHGGMSFHGDALGVMTTSPGSGACRSSSSPTSSSARY